MIRSYRSANGNPIWPGVVDSPPRGAYVPAPFGNIGASLTPETTMKVRNSLRSLKKRDKDCRVIRRKGRVYVINKKNPRFKARQG